jgi:hypothetical protein
MAGAMMSSRGGRIARGLLAVPFVVAGVVVHGIGEIALTFLVRGIGRHVAARR